MHLLKLDEMIKELERGQVLEILTDYDGALEDIPEWCGKTGNEFIGMDEDEDFYKFYVKKTVA
ncbi:MAG: sulfurtransferase TusA family protein [Nitrospirales bacterium]|nr:sulfurtransferase TusA family protein [Nitrospirales bacterium]